MKKKIFVTLLLAILLISCLGICAYAQDDNQASFSYVMDEAELLSSFERQSLESYAAEVSANYGCGVYIVTVNDYRDYDPSGVEPAAEAVYSSYGFGEGSEKTGIMLLLSMDDRDYDILAHGDYAHMAFTDYGKDKLADKFIDDFGSDDWNAGFEDFIAACNTFMDYAQQGNPVDVDSGYEDIGVGTKLIISVPIGCIVALIVCLILRAQMKTANKQTEAREYVSKNGVNMRISQDHFTHRTQTVTVINDDKDSSGGTTVNSNGYSHSSGKF